MIKDINLSGKLVEIEFILPEKIKKFLKKNNLDENQILKSHKWEQNLYEDLLDKNHQVNNDFEKATVVINYINISQDNQIRVPPEDFAKEEKENKRKKEKPIRKKIGSSTWNKGAFFKNFAIGYSIFKE